MWPHHFNMSYNLNLISTLDLSRPLLKCLTFSYTTRANWPKSWFPGGEYSEMIQPLPKYPWLLRFVSSPRIEQLNSSVVSHSGDQGPGALGPWGPAMSCLWGKAAPVHFVRRRHFATEVQEVVTDWAKGRRAGKVGMTKNPGVLVNLEIK